MGQITAYSSAHVKYDTSGAFNSPDNTPTTPCFGGNLPKPKVAIKARVASVTLPTGIAPSAQCSITATASFKKPKKTRSRKYAIGKKLAKITNLSKGRWSFGYEVTTAANGSKWQQAE